jgi:putative ABC transport system substrate-binding protein
LKPKSGKSNLTTFMQGLRKLGWIDGQNVRIEVRWNDGDASLAVTYATDLVGLLRPDVMLAATSGNLIAVQQATSVIPIVFTQVRDPVAQGFVPNLTRPGGNITGFGNTEFSIAGKWADLLKQMVPRTERVALVFDPAAMPQLNLYVRDVEAAAPSLGIQVTTAPVRSSSEIEPTIHRDERRKSPIANDLVVRLGFAWHPSVSHSVARCAAGRRWSVALCHLTQQPFGGGRHAH